MRSTSLGLVVLTSSLFALVLAGCSSGTSAQSGSEASASSPAAAASSADSASFCEGLCTKESACDSRVDAQTCAAKCENVTVSTVTKLRSDVITQARSCYEASDCRQVLTADRLTECIDEAAVSLAPGKTTKDFCESFIEAAQRCDVTLDRAKCLGAMKAYSDETLADARRCLEKSCSQMPDCVSAVFGLPA